MSAPINNRLVCPVTLNSTILILFYLYPKCCGKTELFSSTKGKCVPMDPHLQNKIPTPGFDLAKSQVDVGFPCSNFHTKEYVASFTCNYTVYQASKENKTNPWNGKQYCWDIKEETLNIILITEICNKSAKWIPAILYYESLGLLIITIFLYVAEPELRKKVKDKCFICYMANLAIHLILAGDHLELSGGYFFTNLLGEVVRLSLSCYVLVAFFTWLNVICIHMWRIMKSTGPIPERSFYVYALYAQGLPFILFILLLIDLLIFGRESYLRRLKNGGILSNPRHLYSSNIIAVQQIINISIFIYVVYIIWNQKQKWSGNGNSARHRISQEKNMISKLLKLFIIMGLDWINYTLLNFDIFGNGFMFFLLSLSYYPGFAIFTIYVFFDQRVISAWKKRIG